MKLALLSVFALLALAGCKDASVALSTIEDSHTAAYTTVTEADFATFTAASNITVVDFWATWCGPCKTMAPRFNAAAGELDGIAAFGKIDVDDNPKLAAQFSIRSIPTILILKNGKPVDKIVGLISKDRLTERVRRQL